MAKKKKAEKNEKKTDIHDIKECPDCASLNIVYNEGRQQVICRDCGLIYEPLTPDAEKQFESSHDLMPRKEAPERIMIKMAEEKPKRAKKKTAKKKAPKKQAKKKAVKKAAKKKTAKKKAPKKASKPAKKRSIIGHIRAKLKRKR